MNGHWGIGYDDLNYKSPKELIECLCDCRKVGANYLLNIGPSAQGGIVPIQEEYLKLIGRWNAYFGEAVYNGKPYSICDSGRSFVLRGEDNILYFFVYDLGVWGNEHVVLKSGEGLERSFKLLDGDVLDSVEWMDNGERLQFTQEENKVLVKCTGYHYGSNLCIRVAKARIK